MELAVLGVRLVVVRFADVQEYAAHCAALLGGDGGAFTSVTVTREEVSVVLEDARYRTSSVPAAVAAAGSTIKVEDGWRIIKVEGPLDFSLLGILSRLATTLCEAGVSIFVISTYDTDYLMVKENDLEAAVMALKSCLLYTSPSPRDS